MNIDGLKRDVERRLKRIERAVALDLLAGRLDAADERRFRCLSKIDVSLYLQPGQRVELHRTLFPTRDDRYLQDGIERRCLRWAEWTLCRVDRLGPCVRLLVPGQGSQPWPTADFMLAVLIGHVRYPAGAKATPPRSSTWFQTGNGKKRRR